MKQPFFGIRLAITVLIISTTAMNCTAQSFKKKHYFSFELGGSGGLGSLNVERIFKEKANRSFLWRVGLSYTPIDKNNGGGIIFPVMIHGLVGNHSHKLDIGIGQGITITTRGHFFVRTPVVVGYRFQPIDKSYYIRFAYTPLVSYLIDFQLQHWGGITFGYTFHKP